MSLEIKYLYLRIHRCLNSPVPSNVIAKEIDERPLIKISTANGDRRPILENNILFSLSNLFNSRLLVSNNQSNNK
jgi:hypothetical protein